MINLCQIAIAASASSLPGKATSCRPFPLLVANVDLAGGELRAEKVLRTLEVALRLAGPCYSLQDRFATMPPE